VIVGVDRATGELDARIAARTARMFAAGLSDEVAGLVDRGLREGVTARRAIGYAQVLAHFDGEYDIAEAEQRTVVGTRRYVRRQRSWFRRDRRVRWVDPAAPDVVAAVAALVQQV
jgi:tRNA dimethylallyltransferase